MTDTALDVTEPPFPEQARLEEMVEDIIARARQLGADGVEAGVSIDAGLSVTVYSPVGTVSGPSCPPPPRSPESLAGPL